MSTTPTFQIPQDLIKPAIESAINSAIVDNLGKADELIRSAITSVLNQKVDDSGKQTNTDYRATNYLTWVTNDVIKKAVRSALEEQMIKYKATIEDQLKSELAKKNSPLLKSLIEAFSKSVLDSASGYRLNISIDGR